MEVRLISHPVVGDRALSWFFSVDALTSLNPDLCTLLDVEAMARRRQARHHPRRPRASLQHQDEEVQVVASLNDEAATSSMTTPSSTTQCESEVPCLEFCMHRKADEACDPLSTKKFTPPNGSVRRCFLRPLPHELHAARATSPWLTVHDCEILMDFLRCEVPPTKYKRSVSAHTLLRLSAFVRTVLPPLTAQRWTSWAALAVSPRVWFQVAVTECLRVPLLLTLALHPNTAALGSAALPRVAELAALVDPVARAAVTDDPCGVHTPVLYVQASRLDETMRLLERCGYAPEAVVAAHCLPRHLLHATQPRLEPDPQHHHQQSLRRRGRGRGRGTWQSHPSGHVVVEQQNAVGVVRAFERTTFHFWSQYGLGPLDVEVVSREEELFALAGSSPQQSADFGLGCVLRHCELPCFNGSDVVLSARASMLYAENMQQELEPYLRHSAAAERQVL